MAAAGKPGKPGKPDITVSASGHCSVECNCETGNHTECIAAWLGTPDAFQGCVSVSFRNADIDMAKIAKIINKQFLDIVYLNYKSCSDFRGVSNVFPNLITLVCNYTYKLHSLAGIENLKLEELQVSDNQLSDLDPLKAHPSLCKLDITGNRIKDLSAIASLRLSKLQCNMCSLIDLDFLKGHPTLITLHCWHNQIVSLAGLAGMTTLRELRCNNNNLSTLKCLEGLTLDCIDVSSNPIQDCAISDILKGDGKI